MGEVINFPIAGESGIRQALEHFETTYRKAGLTEDEIAVAMEELEPLVRQFLAGKQFVFRIPTDIRITDDQFREIERAVKESMEDVKKQYGKEAWRMLCAIAGLIGRSARMDALRDG